MPKLEEKKKKRRGDQFGSPLYTYIFINLNIKKLERINISLYDNSGLYLDIAELCVQETTSTFTWPALIYLTIPY